MIPGLFPTALFTTERKSEEPVIDTETGWVVKTLSSPAKEGKRNDTLASLAGYFALTGAGQKVATQVLLLWNSKNSPPLPRDEVEETVKSVYKTIKKKKKTDTPVSVTSDEFALMDFNKYMATYHGQEQRWLVQDWLPDSSIAFVVSAPGGHKTWMLLDLAVSVASGSNFLGKFPVIDKGPVILIQQEDFHGQIVERLSLIAHNRLGLIDNEDTIELPPSLPILIHPDRRLKFSDEKVIAQLEKAVERVKPKLVIIDPLYSAAETDDFMASTAEQMFCLKGLRDKFGTGFVIAHHTSKGAKGSDREQAWGSQFLNAFLETGWQLRPSSGGAIRVRRHFKQFANAKEINLKFEIDSEESYSYRVKEVQEKKDKDKENKKEESEFLKEQKGKEAVEIVKEEEKEPLDIVYPRKTKDKMTMVSSLFFDNKATDFSPNQVAKIVGSTRDVAMQHISSLVEKGKLVKVGLNYRWKNA